MNTPLIYDTQSKIKLAKRTRVNNAHRLNKAAYMQTRLHNAISTSMSRKFLLTILTSELLSAVTSADFFCFFFLWPPWVADADIIFLPCGFYLLLSSFLPRLISAVADWMSTILAHVVGLSENLRCSLCRSETCCTGLAGNTGRKKSLKIAIWAPSHKFVGLYLRN